MNENMENIIEQDNGDNLSEDTGIQPEEMEQDSFEAITDSESGYNDEGVQNESAQTTIDYTETLNELVTIVTDIQEQTTEYMTETLEAVNLSHMDIFGKPLDDYTTSESLLLLIFLLMVAKTIFETIGGIIKCEI